MEDTHFILNQFRSHPFQIHPWKFIFSISLFLLLCFQARPAMASSSWDGVMVTRSDYQTLRAIRHDLVDFRGVLQTWNGSGLGVCSGKWEGIKCVRGQVIAIQLPWKGLGGKISDKIGKLQSLRKLSLHDNVIAGTIPTSLRFLPNLRGLYLFNNRLSGSIPPAIGNCLLLQTLDLSNNTLTGPIPPSLANATTLYRLNLSFNSLSGPIPDKLARFSSLSVFALQHNNLSGPVPETWGGPGNGTSYRVLTVDHNFLSGSIPVSLGKLNLLEELDLSHNQISGTVPGEIGSLSKLQKLDLSNNAINGSFPVAFSNLTSLSFLNLESNLFSDQIPETVFEKMQNLSVLNLKSNQFNGKIPDSVGKVSGIGKIDISENGFSGEIPDSLENLVKLQSFNVSYNDLSGAVPLKLSKKFNSSSFVGNLQLCGFSSSTPCPNLNPPAVSPEPSKPMIHRGRRLSTKDIILIAAGAILALLLLLCCIVLCCVVAKRAGSKDKNGGKGRNRSIGVEKAVASGPEAESGGEAGGKLVHFEGPFVFTADDLLCATAEIMGKSTYGTAYKATLEDGNQVAVKRLREKTTKGQKEFEAEAATLGKIRHHNLLALRAYYLGPKGEKLLVFDYMPKGSLSSFLHARGPETTINWATRMNIITGIARGLHYLHSDENMIHGNLTSSNVLLDEQANAHIADYGLSRLMTAAANTNVIATAGTQGYRAPELPKTKKATTKTDVYSLGVIILELLTGKSPGEGPNGEDLPQWVASIVKEEWTNEVFDLELMRGDDMATTGDELLNTLKLALHCVDPAPEARPEVQQVVHQLEEIRPEHHQGGGDEGALVPFTSE